MPPRPPIVLVLPGGLIGHSGGNIYDRAVVDHLRAKGWSVEVVEDAEDVPPGAVVIQDSLALPHGPMSPGVPVVALVHQLPSEAAHRPEWAEPERNALLEAACVVTVSGWLRDVVGELTDARVTVIPPGRDRAWAVNEEDLDADTVLCVANAFPGKGLPDAVTAFEAASLGDDARLVLASDLDRDPGEAARLRERLQATSANVESVGLLDPEQLSERYARARLLVTASTYEGWPIAVAEAMASGLPVAGFDIPGLRELVRDEIDGYLAPVGDLDALGAAIRRLFTERRVAMAMGSVARERALRWPTWQQTASRFAAVIEDVAGQATGAV